MSVRAAQYVADVVGREQISPHLVRLTLGGDGLSDFASTRVPDEWVGLVVPGQFQSRYYTVRRHEPTRITLDVVVHEVGLVTEWALGASGDPVGQQVTITEPRGSFLAPESATWLLLVGDLTALPAMARIAESETEREVRIHVESADHPDELEGYLPASAEVVWSSPSEHGSRLASIVEELAWPEGEGYFWMAGESAQMRAIRKHLMRERKMPSTHYDVMGYWRQVAERQPRAVDPGPIWRAGKAAGKSDEEIWADYDEARTKAGS